LSFGKSCESTKPTGSRFAFTTIKFLKRVRKPSGLE
jgi:hypothetical protein